MKKGLTIFLQAVIVLIVVMALVSMIRFPLTEGRAANLSLLNIYADPFIIYAYLASIAFFAALYQAFQLLSFVRQNKLFSPGSLRALRVIKYCAMTLGVLVAMAALYIRIFHAKDDDPAGFIALCIVAILISIVTLKGVIVFERTLQSTMSIRREQ